ncbi:hypothetical protein MRX96_005691 [Rhipicephalus microplus]
MPRKTEAQFDLKATQKRVQAEPETLNEGRRRGGLSRIADRRVGAAAAELAWPAAPAGSMSHRRCRRVEEKERAECQEAGSWLNAGDLRNTRPRRTGEKGQQHSRPPRVVRQENYYKAACACRAKRTKLLPGVLTRAVDRRDAHTNKPQAFRKNAGRETSAASVDALLAAPGFFCRLVFFSLLPHLTL